ncbi:MAG: ATP-binding protein [Lachnospiraceae bacterium]|nr:ATP-binding protein [Lachnospiraceae bacterium]
MGWRLKVSGYGKIESAEIETAPLTLFVGDNNSGKSYLMSLLWAEPFGPVSAHCSP